MYPIFKIFQKHTPAAIPPASTGLTAKPYGGQPLAAISHDDDDLFVENKKLQSGPFWPPEAWPLDPWPPRWRPMSCGTGHQPLWWIYK
jgi:hypothetical protein